MLVLIPNNAETVSYTAIMGLFVNISLCYGVRDFQSLPGPTGLAFSQVSGLHHAFLIYNGNAGIDLMG